MTISSVNFQPVKNTSQSHNLRLREFDYVRKDLKSENKSYTNEIPHDQITAELKELVKLNTGRTAQVKAVFIKEGVFLIKPEHTNQQLLKFAQDFGRKFNVRILELHIHRDEGHWDENKVWKSNLHAHILIENINRQTGKSTGWNRDDMIKIQDFFAENLHMERGKKSTKQHIPAVSFKIEKENERLKYAMEEFTAEAESLYARRTNLYQKQEILSNSILEYEEKKPVLNDLKAMNNELDELLRKVREKNLEAKKETEIEYLKIQKEIFNDFAKEQIRRNELNTYLKKHPKFNEWYKLKTEIEEKIPKMEEKINQIKRPGMKF